MAPLPALPMTNSAAHDTATVVVRSCAFPETFFLLRSITRFEIQVTPGNMDSAGTLSSAVNAVSPIGIAVPFRSQFAPITVELVIFPFRTQIQASSEPRPAQVTAKWNQDFSVKDRWEGQMTFFDEAVEVDPIIPLDDIVIRAELPSGRGPYATYIAWSEPSDIDGGPERERVRVTMCPLS